MSGESSLVHLLAGGLGGTVGAVITCPLEVLKTRLQSSASPQNITTHVFFRNQPLLVPGVANLELPRSQPLDNVTRQLKVSPAVRADTHKSIYRCLRDIVKEEGGTALFRGLGANLVGVAPSRAIYFYTYANTKRLLNRSFPSETVAVHMCSAVSAGATASTLTNPIWVLKTRLQLDHSQQRAGTTMQAIRLLYAQSGIRGFYKGITASYVGTIETVIHFVIYEFLKSQVLSRSLESRSCPEERTTTDFLEFMLCGAISKTFASILAYPHEVVRTRLRQEGDKYRSFVQTTRLVAREEGIRALYGGLATQLVRQIPNTAIMMATYELVVYLCSSPG